MALSWTDKFYEIKTFTLANIDYLILAFLLLIFFVLLIKRIIWAISNRHHARIDKLIGIYKDDPRSFEEFIADMYSSKGFNTELTPGSVDGGKDIIMYKAKHKYAVEVKLYNQSHKVYREHIQKLHSAMIDCGADKAIFVTTSDFTAPAYDYAEKYEIETINGEALSHMIKSMGIRI